MVRSTRLGCVVLVAATLSCGPRPSARAPRTVVREQLAPPPPPPPGSAVIYGPLELESLDVARSEVGWARDFVRGERTVVYEAVLAQNRVTCPLPNLEKAEKQKDDEGCTGLTSFPTGCSAPTRLRARTEVAVTFSVVVEHRCAGDPEPYVVPDSLDPRAALSTAGRVCFKAKNKLKPEAQWTSLYELTELRVIEQPTSVTTTIPRLLGALLPLEKKAVRFCRDDAAYLDGAAGAPLPASSAPDPAKLSAAIAVRVPPSVVDAPLSPTFRTEHALWESCNAPAAKDDLSAQERCLLLRQLDRFLREVEDQARPETAKGGP